MSKPLLLFTRPVGTRSGYGSLKRYKGRVKMDRFDIKIFLCSLGFNTTK